MKKQKHNRKFIHRKKIVIAALLFLGFSGIFGLSTLFGIKRNVQEMSASGDQAVTNFPEYPTPNMEGKDPTQIKRGEYLAKAGDCMACHTNTAEKGAPFAGGLPMRTPFGTIYSPNITPDKETGIGNWSDAQFIKAMRTGVSPAGHYYYPAFPYYYFSKISTEDLKAIKAYFDSIPAVKQVSRQPEMVKPFNRRFLQLGWRVLFFNRKETTGPFQENTKQSALWNRGAYLVEGLGHCSMCHSPSYHLISDSLPLGAPISKYDLAGAKIQGYLAPNISKSNLSTISTDEIIKVFTEDRLIGGGNVKGPMLEVNHDSLRYLTHSDQLAIATYLKTVESKTPPIPKSSGGAGGGVYEAYCTGCHTTGAGGAPKLGDAAAWDPLLKAGIDSVYASAINGKGGMPAKGTCLSCSDTEIKQAVDYMVAATKGEAGKTVVAAPLPKPLTLADGKRLYDENCSICHNAGFKGAPKPGDTAAWLPIIKAGFMQTYINVVSGRLGHPPMGACTNCNDAELKAAIKYMMQQSTTTKNYELW